MIENISFSTAQILERRVNDRFELVANKQLKWLKKVKLLNSNTIQEK